MGKGLIYREFWRKKISPKLKRNVYGITKIGDTEEKRDEYIENIKKEG